MKSVIIVLITAAILLGGCSSVKERSNSNNNEMVVEKAVFNEWNEASPVKSELRERGTDLELIVRNWPEEAKPEYIIYNNRKSFPAEIADSLKTGVLIRARIIKRSAVMDQISKSVSLSDRLVYLTPDGNTSFIKIGEWSSMK